MDDLSWKRLNMPVWKNRWAFLYDVNGWAFNSRWTELLWKFFIQSHQTSFNKELQGFTRMWLIINLPTQSFAKKIELIQYNAALAITETFEGPCSEKLFHEFQDRRTGQQSWIYDPLPSMRSSPRHVNSFHKNSYKSEYFKNSFIPNVINKWNKLYLNIYRSTSYDLFRNTLIKIFRSAQWKPFNINNSVRTRLLTSLLLGFIQLRRNHFKHGFRDILSHYCPCNIEAESTTHYFLRCHFYNENRSALITISMKLMTFFLPRMKI